MTGMSGYVKMRNGERICNLSVYVLHHKRQLFEVAKYDTEQEHLEVYQDVLDSVIWPGNDSTHMPASNTVSFRCMYIYILRTNCLAYTYIQLGADSTGAAGKLLRYPRNNRDKSSILRRYYFAPICIQMLIISIHDKLHNCVFASVVLMINTMTLIVITHLLSVHCLRLYFNVTQRGGKNESTQWFAQGLMPFGALGRRADGAPCQSAKGVEGERNGVGSPSPADWGVWGSVLSSPRLSGVQGSAPDKNGFGTFLPLRTHTHMMATNCLEYGITVK